MRRTDGSQPVDPPRDVVAWPEMEDLAGECLRLTRVLARLRGITQSSAPYAHGESVAHVRRTVGGYRAPLIKRVTAMLESITRVSLSLPRVLGDGTETESDRP